MDGFCIKHLFQQHILRTIIFEPDTYFLGKIPICKKQPLHDVGVFSRYCLIMRFPQMIRSEDFSA